MSVMRIADIPLSDEGKQHYNVGHGICSDFMEECLSCEYLNHLHLNISTHYNKVVDNFPSIIALFVSIHDFKPVEYYTGVSGRKRSLWGFFQNNIFTVSRYCIAEKSRPTLFV